VFSHSFKSNSKFYNFCIRCLNSIKLVGKFALLLLVYVVKFSNQSKMYWFLRSQSKFTSSIWVHQTAFEGFNFWGLYFLHPMLVFNKHLLNFMFPLNSTYCGKIFRSIQVVLKVKEQFEVQNSNMFLLHWVSFSNKCFWKVVHTILIYMAKISYQSKKLWVTEKHLSRRRFNLRCIFLQLFLLFFWHLKAILQT